MYPLLVALHKNALMRGNHWIHTTLEVLLPVAAVIFLNLTPFPGPDPPSNQYTNDTIYKACEWNTIDLFMEVLYEPSNSFTDTLMSHVKCLTGFQDVRAGKIHESQSRFKVGVVFKGTEFGRSIIPDTLNYELYPTSNLWNNAEELWWNPSTLMKSYTSGASKKFLTLMHAIDESYVQMKQVPTPKISFENMDLISRTPRLHKIGVMAAFFLCFLLMVPAVVGRLVQEKSTGAKELLLTMGLKKWQLWLAQLTDTTALLLFTELLMVLFLYIPLTGSSQVLSAVMPCEFFGYLNFTIFVLVIFLFFLSTLFNNPALAVFTSQAVCGISLILFIVISMHSPKISHACWMICLLLPHVAFFTGLSIVLDFDYYGKSLNFDEILSGDQTYPTLNDVMVMILFDMMIYSFLTWYLEQVNPGKFGIPKPYNFFLKECFLFRNHINSDGSNWVPADEIEDVDFEFVPNGMKVGISIRNLSKKYKTLSNTCTVTAVDNVSIDFYSGEITALLGHNGAGKTTVFSAISGMTYATSGRIIINDHDVREHTNEARARLGFCPQNDMLFQDLNPFQILFLFAMVKGLCMNKAKDEAWKFIRLLKLKDVMSVCVSKLSGGEKRKVSLAIALIGGSEVVLLDEPTSGLDPEVRREIWETLLQFRGSKTILLTTHFMEEADAVSDRIAIMDHGRIKYYGTPMYLKSKYGSGYSLSVVVKNIEMAEDLTQFIQTHVNGAKLKYRNVLTLTYQLPEEEVTHFPIVFAGLNRMQDSLEIQSYSMNFSTFEDVFIRLRGTDCESVCVDMVDHSSSKILNTSDEVHPIKAKNLLLPFYQFYAFIMKKNIYFRRNFGIYLMYSFIPLLLAVAIFFTIFASTNKIHEKPKHNHGKVQGVFKYSLDLYSNSTALYSVSSENNISRSFAKLVAKHGWNVSLVDNIHKELEKTFKDNFHTYMRKAVMGVDFGHDEVKIFHNSYAIHIMPVALKTVYSSTLLANNVSSEIKTSVNLKYSDRQNKELLSFRADKKGRVENCYLPYIPDYIGFQLLYYLIEPVVENYFGAKHLQLMTSSAALYWFTHLLFDFATFLMFLLVYLVLIQMYSLDDLFSKNNVDIFCGLALWGIGLILLTYVCSTFIKKSGPASATMFTVNCIFTFLVYNLIQWNIWPKGIQYMHPSCILKMGLDNLCYKEDIKEDNYKIALTIYSIVLFAFLVLKDCHIMSNIIQRGLSRIFEIDYTDLIEKDGDVKDQEELVKNLRDSKDFTSNSLVVDGLKRWYFDLCRRSPTVNGISFAVKNGECFGLLGVNGAGKTTSFKMMTGSIGASGGSVFINKYNLFSPIERSRGLFQVGYCPQYGGFIPTFKSKELFELFARLRGLTGSRVTRETSKWTEELDLMAHADTLIEEYSGGNQRKVSLGIALIGNPAVIFLDEPTSGVDPVNRRILWRAISNFREQKKSVLLTSHSMDECEAICSRLAIMVRGNLRCVGEITTLKETFGKGYTVQLKISSNADADDFRAIKEAMSNEFDPGCDLIDEHVTILEYHIKNTTIKWDALFLKLISIKENFDKLESFNASATTLEQIFIYFARNQQYQAI